ncbi:MAG: hypothetical protein HYS41_07075 [Candidatus Omnitrophica bacterium]|nr:hypothetical protein [Candidatus Omnitrophota bacterium]
MQKMRQALVLALAIGWGIVQPSILLAAEHGGKEHGGTASTAASHEGSHGMEMNEAALLKEAAAALRKGQSRPDLAEKLEKLAKSHASR